MRLKRQAVVWAMLRCLPALVFLAIPVFGKADLKVITEMQVSVNGDFRPSVISTSFFKDDWVRLDSANKTLITNSKLGKSIAIDHLAKSFEETPGDINTQAAIMMMQSMGAKISAKVTPTDDQREVAGFLATKYLADFEMELKLPQAGNRTVQMKVHMENWTVTDLPVRSEAGISMGSPNDMMIQSLTALTGVDEVKKELQKIKGFSLYNKVTANLDSPDLPAPVTFEIVYQALKVSTAKLHPAMFAVPAEYRDKSGEFEID